MSDDRPGFRIRNVWLYVAIDPKDGMEGVIAAFSPAMGWMPLVASDERRRDVLRPIADEIGKQRGVVVKLLKFSVREEIETVGGGA